MKNQIVLHIAALFLILNLNAQAENLSSYQFSTAAKDFEEPGDSLNWHAVNDEEVSRAACKVKKLPTVEEMEKYYIDISSIKKDAVIHGVFFKDESDHLLKAFEDLTTSLDMFGIEKKIEQQKNIQSDFNVNPQCQKVICALEKIWGNDNVVRKMLYTYFKYNFNTSELAFNLSSRLTEDELNDIILALEDLPAHLNPLVKRNKRLTHFLRDHTFGNDSGGLVIANAVMILFDPWSDSDSYERQYVLFHELAHNASMKMNDIHNSESWKTLSGWIGEGDKWTHSSNACFVSRYSKRNPGEDFSETMSAYRYNAEYLRTRCPQKYHFVKETIFKGVEYTNLNKCRTLSKDDLRRVRDRIINEYIPEMILDTVSKKEIEKNCKNNFTTYPLKENELLGCLLKIQTSNKNENKFHQILNQEKIFNSLFNREEIINDLVQNLELANSESELSIDNRYKPIRNELNKIVSESFLDDESDSFTKKSIKENDYIWTRLLKKCGKNFFSGKNKDVIKCQITALLNDENLMARQSDYGYFSSYQSPEIFSSKAESDLLNKRKEYLLAYLLNHQVAKNVEIIQNENFKRYMKFHINEVNNKLPLGWQNLSPKEFCYQTYSKTFYWLQMFGYKNGENVPELQKTCEKQQASRPKRFLFDSSTWMNLLK